MGVAFGKRPLLISCMSVHCRAVLEPGTCRPKGRLYSKRILSTQHSLSRCHAPIGRARGITVRIEIGIVRVGEVSKSVRPVVVVLARLFGNLPVGIFHLLRAANVLIEGFLRL